MLFQNLSTQELEDLLIEETKKYTSSLHTDRENDLEQIRLRIEVLIKALSERKESDDRIKEIIQMIDNKYKHIQKQKLNRGQEPNHS